MSHKHKTTFKKIIDELHMIILSESLSQIIISALCLNYKHIHFWIIINEEEVVKLVVIKNILLLIVIHPLSSPDLKYLKVFNSQVNQSCSGK